MNLYNLKYKMFGERSILVEWPQQINNNILQNILSFKNELKKIYCEKIYAKNSYNSLLVSFPNKINTSNIIFEFDGIYKKLKYVKKQIYKCWEIPVCYEIEFGKDLIFLKKQLSIDIDEIILLHTSNEYKVFNIGFLPGFLYLGGLNKKIHYPRKNKPDLYIEKGSVGIGGGQTGIYPNESPGGWNIIGKTPIELFNSEKKRPCFINPGDNIKFTPISKKKFSLIKNLVEADEYKIKKTMIND